MATFKLPIPGASSGAATVRRDGRTTLAWLLLFLVLVAPFPAGSNRPVIWLMLVGGLGLLGVIWFSRRGAQVGGGLRGWFAVIAIAMAQPVWGVVQTMGLSIDPGATLLAVVRMTANLGFFMLALEAFSRPGLGRRILPFLFVGICAHALWGLVALRYLGDVAPWGEKIAYMGDATGAFVGRSAFAAYLGMGLVLGVVLLAECWRSNNMARVGYLLGIAVITAALISTHSRLGVSLGILAAILAAVLMGASRRLVGLVVVLAALCILALGAPLLDRAFAWRGDVAVRWGIYTDTLRLIAERPLTGFGLDSFALAYEAIRSEAQYNAFVFTDAHSSYLESWAEAGVIFGSMPFIAGSMVLSRLMHSQFRNRARVVAAITTISLAATHSLLDFSYEIEANLLLLLFVTALGALEAHPRR
ncbi:O-antigen ligase family protein [Sinirhodobacter sp. WL0062]|uniref:O-antigen ligase family protein n=1 Tax=Rhodobacter flavimaris TaxID=2907145 RepID=A0ABS8YQK4_9RHOB|nr:O-antigen ligase family protein [Sinirhodobacter sp. WL0062]MCE5972177.1 O-antigen ligase family protein [Sinirhodobacter sp. WL0062]